MMGRVLVIAGFVVLRCFAMVARRVFVMLGCLVMMLCRLFGHCSSFFYLGLNVADSS